MSFSILCVAFDIFAKGADWRHRLQIWYVLIVWSPSPAHRWQTTTSRNG